MRKKLFLGIISLLSISYNVSCAVATEKVIFVGFDPQIAQVQVLPSRNLMVTPLAAKLVPLKVTASTSFDTSMLSILKYDQVLASADSSIYEQSPIQYLVKKSPSYVKVHADITQVNPLESTGCYHDIHNGGYVHAASSQEYAYSAFGFAANGCVKLNPSNTLGQRLQSLTQPAQQGTDITQLFGLGLELLANHSNKAAEIHQGSAPQSCSISSIMVRPFDQQKRDVPVAGTLNYGELFSMDLATLGASLELVPNKGFSFLIN